MVERRDAVGAEIQDNRQLGLPNAESALGSTVGGVPKLLPDVSDSASSKDVRNR